MTRSAWLLSYIIYFSTIVIIIDAEKAAGGTKLKVVYAVNCGGEEHTGLDGVHYEADQLMVGIASEFGRRYSIARVPPQDAILYQTERYYTTNFAYDIPIAGDGDYVLDLKFSEVYFTSPGQKVRAILFHFIISCFVQSL